MEDRPADLTLSVQASDSDGTLVDQGFVSLVPLFCSSTLRARVNAELEMLLATWCLVAMVVLNAFAVTPGAGVVFCTNWVF